VLPDNPVLRKYPNAPHPFALVPPLDTRTSIPAGSPLNLDVTLIGPGIEYLPHFIRVFQSMGASGKYGGAFQLESVQSLVTGDLVYDGAVRRILKAPPVWEPPAPNGGVGRMRLEFLTPLRMRTDGRYNAAPDFVAITHALLRRIHLLAALYSADAEPDWMRPLLAQADAVATERADFRMYRWDRQSGRQQRRVAMDGVVGTLEASGDLTALAPYFAAGEWLNVGSGTSMGMGKYCMALQHK
jgi:hypothetical protein